jgi:uncharacterized protein YdaU (DUF1376 family)
MNYYSFHVGDYVLHTAHLSIEEDIAYRRLLDLYYTSESPIPLDIEKVSKLIRMRDQSKAVADVLGEFFVRCDDGFHSKRADEEIAAYRRMASGGRAGAAKRWGSHPDKGPNREGNTGAIATPSPPQANPNSNQEPITNNQEPIKEKSIGASRFDACRHLVDQGVDEQVARDWLTLRRQKKATPTETAIAGVAREAAKARMTLQDALKVCCARGWVGFKADWVTNTQTQQGKSGYHESLVAAGKAIFGSVSNGQDGGNIIDITPVARALGR